MHLIVPIPYIALILLAIWIFTDRVIYKGAASVIANNMKHYSTSHKTVMVVPHGSTSGASKILVATVTNAKAASIAASHIATHQIIVRKRLFGQPRVTRVS
jgi:phosphohistidine phosphatase SixA